MAREVRTSSRLDSTLLDRGLAASAEAGETYIKQADAVANRVTAEGQGIENLGLAKKNFWTSYGSGVRIGLIASGAGLGSLLFLLGVSFVVDAFRRPYTTSAYNSVVEQNAFLTDQVAQISRVLAEERTKPSVEATKPASETKTETPVPAPASTEVTGVATTAVPFDQTQTDCPSNLSYTERCIGVHKYADGQSYQGEWKDGLPDGDGSLTMVDGAKINGTWSAGLPSSVKLPTSDVTPLKTVTVFMTQSGSSIDPTIIGIVVGHEFEDGNSEMWYSAYCYAQILEEDGLTKKIDLSRYENPTSEIFMVDYRSAYSGVITLADFREAQRVCPYVRSDFNLWKQ